MEYNEVLFYSLGFLHKIIIKNSHYFIFMVIT